MMIKKEKLTYRIEGLLPTLHMSMGGYGFCVLLDKCTVDKLLSIPYSRDENITKIAMNTISRIFGERNDFWRNPCVFMMMSDGEPSSLIQYCTVPGDACSLGIDFGDIDGNIKYDGEKKWVMYSTHNVDSPTQAYALLSLWLQWMNTIHVLFKDEN